MPAVHVAIVGRAAAGQLLSGAKRIETRFSRRRRPPFGRVLPGDIIHFKLAGGGFIGTSHVMRLREFEDLTPTTLRRLCRQYNHAVRAPQHYWRSRRRCRFGLLIWIRRLAPPPAGVRVPRQYGNAWLVLGPA